MFDFEMGKSLEDNDIEHMQETLWMYFYCFTFIVSSCSLLKAAEKYNRLDLKYRAGRMVAGFLEAFVHLLHSRKQTLPLRKDEAAILAAGPHRTGAVEAFALASNMEGAPPRYFATDTFFKVPYIGSLIKRFMKMFEVIVVDFTTNTGGKTNARSAVLEAANRVLQDKGRVALFPQGNLAYIGEDAHIVYNGAAKMAIHNSLPIQVVRLDGFWSLENPLLPLFVKNDKNYRGFGSLAHPNDVKTNLCWEIDVHLRPENVDLPEAEKIRLINAELYAFFRHTQELTLSEIDKIKMEIESGEHLEIWDNKFGKYHLSKTLSKLEGTIKALETELLEAISAQEEKGEEGENELQLPTSSPT